MGSYGAQKCHGRSRRLNARFKKRPEVGALIPRSRASYFRLERVLGREARLSEHLLEGYSALKVITWKMCKMSVGSLNSSRSRLRGPGLMEEISLGIVMNRKYTPWFSIRCFQKSTRFHPSL